MAHQYVQREMLQKQINVSGLKGVLGSNSKIRHLTDPFSVFQKIKEAKIFQTSKFKNTMNYHKLG